MAAALPAAAVPQARSKSDQRTLCEEIARQFMENPAAASINQLAKVHAVPVTSLFRALTRARAAAGGAAAARRLTPRDQRQFLNRKGGGQPFFSADAKAAFVTKVTTAAFSGKWLTTAGICEAAKDFSAAGKKISRRTASRIKAHAENEFGVLFKPAVPVSVAPAKAALDFDSLGDFVRKFHSQVLRPTEPLQLASGVVDLRTFKSFSGRLDVWNIDETAVEINKNAKNRPVWALDGQKFIAIPHATLSCHISLITAVSNNGATVPPYIIVESPCVEPLAKFILPSIPSAVVDCTPSGYSDQRTWAKLLAHICSHARRAEVQKEDAPLIFLIDNSGTHFSLAAGEILKENNSFFVTLPPNSTHILQPLDARNGPHGALKKEFRAAVAATEAKSLSTMKTLELLGGAIKKGYDPLIIQRAWKETGLDGNYSPEEFIAKKFNFNSEKAMALMEKGHMVPLTDAIEEENKAAASDAQKIVGNMRLTVSTMQAEGRFGMSGDKLIEIAEEKKRADEAKAGEKRKREEEKAEKKEIQQKAKEESARGAELKRRIRDGEPVKIRLKVDRARGRYRSLTLIGVG